MKKIGIIFTVLSVLTVPSAYAQVEGSFKADGAWNFKKNNAENADMNYLKIVTTKPMHRSILLGVNYVF